MLVVKNVPFPVDTRPLALDDGVPGVAFLDLDRVISFTGRADNPLGISDISI